MNYGSVTYNDKRWMVACEPHVRGRFKRVFPRAPQRAADVIPLSDTPEHARELLWFLERYPMDMTRADRRRLKRSAVEHVDMEMRIADLLARRDPPSDVNLALPLRGYQAEVMDFLLARRGMLLADDVGLGKTVSSMTPLTRSEYLPAVVVCPAHIPWQWAEQLAIFLPQLRVHIVNTSKVYPLVRENKRQTDLWEEALPDVIIISYHKLRSWADTLGEIARYVIFDECQQLRHPGTDIYAAAATVSKNCHLRLGLSATPIHNYGGEIHHIFSVLAPDALGTHEEFIRENCTHAYGEKPRFADPTAFGLYLRREGLMLRRTRAEVGRELPPVSKVHHLVDADSAVLDSYAEGAERLARIILSHNERYRGERMQAAGQFDILLRQATGVAKARYVADFVSMLAESGEKIVLFGWHREVYSIWAERLAPLKPVFYTGTEDAKAKAAALKAFKSGDSQVLVMSLRSGAGVDGLQGVGSLVVFGELDWAPAVIEQAIGRLHRDGQGDPVTAYFLLSEEGSDPIMSEILGIKRQDLEGLRNPGLSRLERADQGIESLRALARTFLQRRGRPLDAPADAREMEVA